MILSKTSRYYFYFAIEIRFQKIECLCLAVNCSLLSYNLALPSRGKRKHNGDLLRRSFARFQLFSQALTVAFSRQIFKKQIFLIIIKAA